MCVLIALAAFLVPADADASAPAEGPPEQAAVAAPSGGALVLNWLEEFLPIFVEVFTDRLALQMEAVGERSLTRRYTEEEFRRFVLERVQEKFKAEVTDIAAKIRPDELVGSATLRLDGVVFPVTARIGIRVKNERAHLVIREIRLEPFMVTEEAGRMLEGRVNKRIDRKPHPLKIKRYELREGYAVIAVEVAQ